MKKRTPFLKMNRNIILYIIFGVLTTVVNYLIYFPLFYLADLSAWASSIIAWFFSVLFSFFTNKIYVFKSTDLERKNVLREFFCFVGCRLMTGAVESLSLFVLVDVFIMSGWFWKLAVSVLIVICNYITGLLVFKHN